MHVSWSFSVDCLDAGRDCRCSSALGLGGCMVRQHTVPPCSHTSTGRHIWGKGHMSGQMVCRACSFVSTLLSSPVCEQSRHDFRMVYSSGWYECVRIGCHAYAVCPGCLNCVIVDAVVQFCGKHLHLSAYLGDYPVRAYSPSLYAVLTHEPGRSR